MTLLPRKFAFLSLKNLNEREYLTRLTQFTILYQKSESKLEFYSVLDNKIG